MQATQASCKTDFPCTLDLQLHVLEHFHFVSSPLLGGSIVPCLAKLNKPLLAQLQSKNVLEVLLDICIQLLSCPGYSFFLSIRCLHISHMYTPRLP